MMSGLLRIDQDGRFSVVAGAASVGEALPISEVSSPEQIAQLLSQETVSLRLDGFADGRGFSVARQLRLQGFSGAIEVIGDLLPDQLPMAVASGIDAILIRVEHAERCDETQWRQSSADKKRFLYQRSVAPGVT